MTETCQTSSELLEEKSSSSIDVMMEHSILILLQLSNARYYLDHTASSKL